MAKSTDPEPGAKKKRPQKKAKGRYHHGNLRRAILDAALAVVQREGPHSVTLSQAARQAGVSSGAPFHHFANKGELMAAIVREGAEHITRLQSEELARAADDPIAAFMAAGIAHVKFAVLYPAHFRVMAVPEYAALSPSPEMEEALAANDRAVSAIVKRRPGRPGPPTLATMELAGRCLMHGLASMFVGGQMSTEGIGAEEAEKIAREMVGVLAGMGRSSKD